LLLRGAIAAFGLVMLAGCVWGLGPAFVSLDRATVTGALTLPADRQDAAGRLKTDNGYQLLVAESKVRVYLGRVALLGPAPAGGSAAEVLGLAPFDPVLFVPLGGEYGTDTFTCQGPNVCQLPPGTIATARLDVTRLQAYGSVQAGPGLTAPIQWEIDLPTPGVRYDASAPATIDRAVAPRLAFGGRLQLTERLFDGIEWARLAQAAPGETLHLETDERSKAALLANLAKSQWTAELKRYSGD
jgi:hypothetical protein